MSTYNIISADAHVEEVGDVWVQHIDKELRDRAPRTVLENGQHFFVCEGLPRRPVGMYGGAGTKSEKLKRMGRYDERRTGGWDPDARIKDMQTDGMDAEVLYPTTSMSMFQLKDTDYLLACFKAYNDWLAEYCSAYPDKLKGIALVPLQDVEQGVLELRRAVKKGLCGAMIAILPDQDKPYSLPMYDPFWATAQEMGTPVSLHVSTGRWGNADLSNYFVDYPMLCRQIQHTLGTLIFGGVLERFPDLKIVSAENDIGWIPAWLRRADYCYQRNKHWQNFSLKTSLLPSDLFRRHVFCTFQQDEAGIQLRHMIGVDNIMWASDYPHIDSTWPESQEVIARHFSNVPEDEKRKIILTNAGRLYGFL